MECGGGEGDTFTGQLTVDSALTSLHLELDTKTSQAKITMSGPNGKYFAVGFNSPNFKMADKPYTVVVDGAGNVSERRLGDHDPGTVLEQSVSVASNTVGDQSEHSAQSRDHMLISDWPGGGRGAHRGDVPRPRRQDPGPLHLRPARVQRARHLRQRHRLRVLLPRTQAEVGQILFLED